MVRVAGFEPTASWTRTKRATNCATPGYGPMEGGETELPNSSVPLYFFPGVLSSGILKFILEYTALSRI